MSKKIVIINGSPRKNGNSELLVDAFVEGAIGSGNIVTKFNVGRMKINGCIDCILKACGDGSTFIQRKKKAYHVEIEMKL